ncbi:LPS export ABC transporter periplasmic protein LptC [Pasteurella canis]|uniref:Lipopolysaccharide export system protein LptC n=2 Tax=Pasteurella canis TaxID=753 RepID=A0A379EV26_9PAST|nr:LPS export ABC transporter periplasmic protein LptC [Pasteurella canis]MXN89097.1 LPS export ABC transporter periplasmic protein LptC [Pasteurella canis]UAX41336.1 LPS export ABC transporter periplasmic protein LptC [Pasteurella canis]UEA15985.1 LPS export ABC transporter periplasmic protein LptC [Pasteurella canis]UEC22418.1 LPS export ABC transporter periplasmic protein LptC [Pasteurella canis]SUC10210.1 lipopolysaccharide export system protein LptC [Pasteurella canis]
MNIRWNIVLSAIALVLLAWFYSLNQSEDNLSTLIKKPDSPEYTGQKMRTTVFSPTGKKQYFASAESISHFTTSGKTHFQMPMVYLFDIDTLNTDSGNDKESWKLSANKAVLTKNNMLYLEGNVIAESLFTHSRLQRVETESAVVNLSTQDITSDTTVKIYGQNFHSTGLKLSGNLHQQIATLKEQVNTYYEINKQ